MIDRVILKSFLFINLSFWFLLGSVSENLKYRINEISYQAEQSLNIGMLFLIKIPLFFKAVFFIILIFVHFYILNIQALKHREKMLLMFLSFSFVTIISVFLYKFGVLPLVEYRQLLKSSLS